MNNLFQYLTTHTILVHNDLSKELIEWSMRISGHSNLIGFPFWSSKPPETVGVQLISDFVIRNLYYLLTPFLTNNLLIIFSLLLAFTSMYLLARYFDFSKLLAVCLSLIFATQPYLLYRFMSVSESLFFIFLFPIVIYALSKRVNLLLMGLLVSVIFYVSNYYGYFSILLCLSWWTYTLILEKKFVNYLFQILWFFVSIFMLVGIPQFEKVTHSTVLLGQYNIDSLNQSNLSEEIPLRGIDDFFFFSNRPWYHLFPPNDAVIGSNFSSQIYSKLKSSGNYLFQNYDTQEAGGEYIPIPLLIIFILSIIYWRRNGFGKIENKNYGRLLFLLLIFELISYPPYLDLFSHRIYLPSYVLHYIMPGFRVLVRFAVIHYLLLVILIGFYLQGILVKFPSLKPVVIAVTFIVISFNLIKLPIYDINGPILPVVSELSNYPEGIVGIYPQNDYHLYTDLIINKQKVINPEYYKTTNFSANEFTKNFPSESGFMTAKSYGVTYLIYSKNHQNATSEKQQLTENLFNKNLKKLYEDTDYIIYVL